MQEIFEYNLERGVLTRRFGGYVPKRVTVYGKEYSRSRIAWWVAKGEDPGERVIFLDGDIDNLVWSNLVRVSQINPKKMVLAKTQICPVEGILRRLDGSEIRSPYVVGGGVKFLIERVAWMHYYEKDPDRRIKFLNSRRRDLRKCNLRLIV